MASPRGPLPPCKGRSTTPAASGTVDHEGVKWQVIIHLAFVLSAIALAWTDKLMMAGVKAQATESH